MRVLKDIRAGAVMLLSGNPRAWPHFFVCAIVGAFLFDILSVLGVIVWILVRTTEFRADFNVVMHSPWLAVVWIVFSLLCSLAIFPKLTRFMDTIRKEREDDEMRQRGKPLVRESGRFGFYADDGRAPLPAGFRADLRTMGAEEQMKRIYPREASSSE